MLKKTPRLILLLLSHLFVSCSPQLLKLNEIPNFNPAAKNSMLFLTFEFNKKGKKETAQLIKSIAAEGKVKDANMHIHGQYLTEIMVYNTGGTSPKTYHFEHPLFKDVEVFSEDGTIKRVSEKNLRGLLTVRIPIDDNMDKLELFSIANNHESKNLLTLKFTP